MVVRRVVEVPKVAPVFLGRSHQKRGRLRDLSGTATVRNARIGIVTIELVLHARNLEVIAIRHALQTGQSAVSQGVLQIMIVDPRLAGVPPLR